MFPAISCALALLLSIASCGRSAGGQDKVSSPPPAEGKIAVPGAERGAKGGADPTPPAVGQGATEGAATAASADDPRFHLKPEEGTLTVGTAEGPAGSEVKATIALAPNPGYKVAVDYPTKLVLTAPEGVALTKLELTAGGRNKAKGDATTWTEQAFAFDVKATAGKPGSYEIRGVFKFGVCDKDSCHPKKQPITISVAAR